MYHFAIIALLALALVKVVDFLVDNVSSLERLHSLMTFAGGVGAVWLLDYSMFAGFGVAVRDHGTGVWITGFLVAGMTVPWRALFGYLTHDKAMVDETLGHHMPLRKAA